MIGAIHLLKRPLVDLRLGMALMKDRRVPLRSKLTAALMGLAITGIVEFLEIPIEGVIAAVLPIFGITSDVMIDGAEAIAGPLLLATALLPHIAPRHIVEQIRAERAGKPMIDV